MTAAYGDSRLPQRFWDKVVPESETGCWLWVGYTMPGGYGQCRYEGKAALVHRITYDTLVGSIGPEKQIDHLCRQRSCVRPDHLEMVTHRENLLRGVGWSGENSRKSHCPRGHELAGNNLARSVWINYGHRKCRTCENARVREYNHKRKASK